MIYKISPSSVVVIAFSFFNKINYNRKVTNHKIYRRSGSHSAKFILVIYHNNEFENILLTFFGYKLVIWQIYGIV